MTRAHRSRRPVTSSPTRPKPHVVILIASSTRGVAALVGNTYGAAKDVGVYVTGEAIRRLADLEAKERERCANFASKLASRNWTTVSTNASYAICVRPWRPNQRAIPDKMAVTASAATI